MTAQYLIVGLVAAQRLWEMWYARRNTQRLRDAGAVEYGAEHYPLFVVLHAAWLLGLILWPGRELAPGFLVVFLVLQALRVWVLIALGERWSTRVLVLPGEPLVRAGPYRYVKHPNYLIVAGEIAVLPLVFGLWEFALAFSCLNAALLLLRIRVEDRALAQASAGERE